MEKRHVLIAVRDGKPEIAQIFAPVDEPGSWGRAVEAWALLDDERLAAGIDPRALHYAVRDSDHELAVAAATAVARKLGPRQREVLKALALATPEGGWIKPGSRKRDSPDPRRWGRAAAQTGMRNTYTGDIAPPARKLAKAGLIAMQGLDYAPKSYSVTLLGRLVAERI